MKKLTLPAYREKKSFSSCVVSTHGISLSILGASEEIEGKALKILWSFVI